MPILHNINNIQPLNGKGGGTMSMADQIVQQFDGKVSHGFYDVLWDMFKVRHIKRSENYSGRSIIYIMADGSNVVLMPTLIGYDYMVAIRSPMASTIPISRKVWTTSDFTSK
jgi:hypothetical protein